MTLQNQKTLPPLKGNHDLTFIIIILLALFFFFQFFQLSMHPKVLYFSTVFLGNWYKWNNTVWIYINLSIYAVDGHLICFRLLLMCCYKHSCMWFLVCVYNISLRHLPRNVPDRVCGFSTRLQSVFQVDSQCPFPPQFRRVLHAPHLKWSFLGIPWWSSA